MARDLSVAEQVVQESLGLSADDLGMNRDDPFAGLNFDDDGEEVDTNDLEGDDNQGEFSDQQQIENDPFNPTEPQQRQQRPDPSQSQNRKLDDLSVSHTQGQPYDIKRIKYDPKGNVLSSDGKRIIATAGREARLFVDHHKTKEQLGVVQTQARTAITEVNNRLNKAVEIGTGLAQQLKAVRESGTAYSSMGLNDNENRQALELAVLFKRSPVEAIKNILTQATARGIDLTTLGLQPGGFDTQSLLQLVRTEITNATKPLQDANQRQTAQSESERVALESRNAATSELNTFLITNPDAKQYLPVFERIYAVPEFQNMSLNEVWLRIQLNLAQQQRNPQQQSQRPNLQNRNRQQPRVPNGRQNPPGATRDRQAPQSEGLAPVSMSYEDIVKSVL